MNVKEYRAKAMRTCASLPAIEYDNKHMFLGMLTEIGELGDVYKKNLAYKKEIDLVNVKEEVGDLMWYIANFCNFHEIEPIEFKNHKMLYVEHDNIDRIFMMVERMSSIRSRSKQTNYLEGFISDMLTHVYDFCIYNRFDLEEILDTNIEKLQARYPEKFTEVDALNRNLKKEREILESENHRTITMEEMDKRFTT